VVICLALFSLKYKEIIRRLGSPGNGYGDVYWVDASIINKLKPEDLKKEK
jgi:hypothetical protein